MDKVWAEVSCAKQTKKELFHRFVVQVLSLVKDLATLSGVGDTEAGWRHGQSCWKAVLTKRLQHRSPGLLNKISSKYMDGVVELGTNFHTTHSGATAKLEKMMSSPMSELSASAQCSHVALDPIERKLKATDVKDRHMG